MAVVDIPAKKTTLRDRDEITKYLVTIGIDYERWEGIKEVPADLADAEILEAYAEEIEELKAKGGYVTADVINVVPQRWDWTRCLINSTKSTGTMRTRCGSL